MSNPTKSNPSMSATVAKVRQQAIKLQSERKQYLRQCCDQVPQRIALTTAEDKEIPPVKDYAQAIETKKRDARHERSFGQKAKDCIRHTLRDCNPFLEDTRTRRVRKSGEEAEQQRKEAVIQAETEKSQHKKQMFRQQISECDDIIGYNTYALKTANYPTGLEK